MLYVVTRRVYEDAFIQAETAEEAMERAVSVPNELYWYSAVGPDGKIIPEKYLRVIPKSEWGKQGDPGPGE